MRKGFFYTIVALLLVLSPASAKAQTDEHKFEVGAVFSALGGENLDESAKGLGARLGYNFTEHFALDAETTFFPSDRFGNNLTGQNVQGFAGVKAGGRSKYVGVFGKLRPGVMFIGESTSGFDCGSGGSFNICRPNHNHLALDAGIVAEVYPSSRTIIRVDLGDTIVRFKQAGRNIFTGVETSSTNISHNFQASVGFGYRF
jgi:hypothetical protein